MEASFRRTGRTTKLLERVYDLLYEGEYGSIVYVVHHKDFIRYCAMVVCEFCPQAMLTCHNNRMSFRNRYGQLVHIQFVPMDREHDMTRGYKNPVARDHEVVRLRLGYMRKHERMEVDKLSEAGRQPISQFYIPLRTE